MPKSDPIPVRFEASTVRAIEALAGRLHMPRSEIIERAVEAALHRFRATNDYRFLMEFQKHLPLDDVDAIQSGISLPIASTLVREEPTPPPRKKRR